MDTRLRTVVTCSGREATCPLATILALESPTTSEPQANQLNQSNENDLEEVDQITRNNELESGYSLGVKGNLKNNLGFWRSIGAPDFILSIIENGYRLPFISFPLAVKLGNNKSARLHADFVDQAVLELVNSGRVRIVNEQPFVVNPLSVSIQPCGKKRLILDLRHVNKSLIKQSVKYEDWKIAMAYFAKDAHMFSFDLKSGYHHIDIAHEHQTFLGFSWRSSDSVNEVFYVFTVLPFGLSSAPYVFTKVLKPLEKYWRIQGLRIAIFLDDGWAIVQDRESCRIKALAVRGDLYNAGFVVNEDKSVWEPTQVLDWLGITWNSALGTLKIVERRIVKIINTMDLLLKPMCLRECWPPLRVK